MVLFIILGVVVLITFVVLGVLFFMLSKEGEKKKEDEKAVPLTDLNQLKNEFSSGLLEPQQPAASKLETEIIPPFEPKVPLPINSMPSLLQENEFEKSAKELEEELQAITQKADEQSQEAKRMIEVLTSENEALKGHQEELEAAKQKLIELQGEATILNSQNANLQTQLEAANAKVQILEEQMAAFKVQMGEEITRANETVTALAREKEAISSSPKEDTGPLNEKIKELESANQKLQEEITQLNEKNDSLQYELIKARAQTSGLERVSNNYKNQLEDLLKNSNAAQSSNEDLAKDKVRLEAVVEEIKLQNEELLKKDQLSQFELEKNRSRLVSLEREYEDFKARTQQEKG